MKVCVVGGGASGMAAAIRLAREGVDVTLLEKNDRVGKKILSTGNGKCNLGNMDISPSHYYSSDASVLEGFLSDFTHQDTIAFFDSLGLMVKNKNGYLYPYGEQASLVLDVLRHSLQVYGATVRTACNVEQIIYRQNLNQFEVTSQGQKWLFDRVVLATGGKAAPKTGSDGWGYRMAKSFGHTLVPDVPALHPIKCREDYFKSVAGVRAEGRISFMDQDNRPIAQRGEIQLTANGISGIPVFQISRIVGYLLQSRKSVPIHIDFFPDYDAKQLMDLLMRKKDAYETQTAEEYFNGFLNKKLMLLFMKLAGIRQTDMVSNLTEEHLRSVAHLMKDWVVNGIFGFSYEQAQVTAGGVPLSELNEYLESKKQKGLYMVGELLDVDGICGGYNLHWAWCSGYLAAEGICNH